LTHLVHFFSSGSFKPAHRVRNLFRTRRFYDRGRARIARAGWCCFGTVCCVWCSGEFPCDILCLQSVTILSQRVKQSRSTGKCGGITFLGYHSLTRWIGASALLTILSFLLNALSQAWRESMACDQPNPYQTSYSRCCSPGTHWRGGST
jgi:hypothetical protein